MNSITLIVLGAFALVGYLAYLFRNDIRFALIAWWHSRKIEQLKESLEHLPAVNGAIRLLDRLLR